MKAAREASRLCQVWGMGCYPHTSLLQIPFGGVLVKRKPALCKCLHQSGEKKGCVGIGFSNRRNWLCFHTRQPTLTGESLLESPHCYFVPLWAWLFYPQHLLCQVQGLGWVLCSYPLVLLPGEVGAVGPQGLSRGSWTWAENLSALEKEPGSCPPLGKICPLRPILSLPTSAGAWPLICVSLLFSELLLISSC